LSAPLKLAGKPRIRNSWNWIGFALSVTIVGISIYVLANILKDVDFARVATHVRSMPATQIGWAVLFIAGAYATLTCYDFFAVRTIGANHVPYPIAALASFTSYSIGHNIGVTAVSGGAIRYRIYSQFGLGIIDVTKVCFLTGLTFWLGNLAVLGSGMALRPDVPGRIFQLPPETMRAIGITGLLLLCVYLVWASRRPRNIGMGSWNVTLPSGTSTLIQIGIGLADLGCSSFAMYNLLPPSVQGEPLSIITAFVSATLLGFASHAPGSLGVFEAAMLVAVPEVPKEELLAALLVFRILYFLGPFCLALVTMACWESVLFVRRSRAAARNGTAVTHTISEQPPAHVGRPPYTRAPKPKKPKE
jgi:glycosyltransferase 2 family protein